MRLNINTLPCLEQLCRENPGVEYRLWPRNPMYAVGDDGSLWSRQTTRRTPAAAWRQLKLATQSARGGHHKHTTLSVDGRKRCFLLHRVVLETFVGPCPDGMEGCHNDGDPANNRAANLRWDSHKSNMRDMEAHGKMYRGSQKMGAKLSEKQVLEIRRLRAATGLRYKDIAAIFGVSLTTAQQAARGTGWKHVG